MDLIKWDFFLEVTYNGNGDVLPPILVHSGQINDIVQQNFEPFVSFVHTPNGLLNYDVAAKVVDIIHG